MTPTRSLLTCTVLLAACAGGGAPALPAPDAAPPAAHEEAAPAWALAFTPGGSAGATARVGDDREQRGGRLGEGGVVNASAARDGTERTLACGRDFQESRARARASLRAGADSAGGLWQGAEVSVSARGGRWREKGTLTCGRRRTSEAEATARVGFALSFTAEGDSGITDLVLVRATGQPVGRLGLRLVDSAGTTVPLEPAGEAVVASVAPGTYQLTGTLQASVTPGADGAERELARRATIQVQGLRAALAALAGAPVPDLRRRLEVPLATADLAAALDAGLVGDADAWRPCPDAASCGGRGEDLLVQGASATAVGGGVRVAVGLTGRGERTDSLVFNAGLAGTADSVRLVRLARVGGTLDRRTAEAVGSVVAARLAELAVPVRTAVGAASLVATPVRWAGTCVSPAAAVDFLGVRAATTPSTIRLLYGMAHGAPAACAGGGPGR